MAMVKPQPRINAVIPANTNKGNPQPSCLGGNLGGMVSGDPASQGTGLKISTAHAQHEIITEKLAIHRPMADALQCLWHFAFKTTQTMYMQLELTKRCKDVTSYYCVTFETCSQNRHLSVHLL